MCKDKMSSILIDEDEQEANEEVNMKIMSWNVQGALKSMVKRELVVEHIIKQDTDIVLLQEPGDITIEELQEIKILFQRQVGQVKIIFKKTGLRYGGVMTIVFGTWVNRLCYQENDERELSRYNAIRIRGKEGKIISVINIYRPHFQSTGEASVAESIRRYLEKNKIDDMDPETLWEEDLQKLVDKEANNALIVGGDFNKRIEDRITSWSLISKHQMYNILQRKYDKQQIPPTRIPGDKGAIDHILISNYLTTIDAKIEEETALSDHIPIKATILGHDWFYHITPKNSIVNRILNSSNPQAIKKYREILEKSLTTHRIRSKLDELNKKLENGATEECDRKVFSDIVALVDKLTVEAEEKALGQTRGHRNLSKQERKIRYEIICWGKLLAWSKYSGKGKWKKTKIKKILRLLGKEECEVNTITKTEATAGLKQAWEKWRETVESKWRVNNEWRFYEEAKGRQTLGDSRDIETIIATLKHQAIMKTRHMRIKQARGKAHGEGLTILEVEEEDGTKTQIHQKEQIERIAIRECWKKVHTADSTPLWKEPLAEIIEIRKGPEEWNKLFEDGRVIEKIDPLEISRGAKLFIREMSLPCKEENIKITHEEYWKGWKKQREKTASYGRINFSHFMGVTMESEANIIRASIASLRLTYGITPDAYKQATDVLLLKTPNDFRPHRMRLITLQHAASNHDFKFIGKKISEIGEKNKCFSECQYGSRKHKAAATQALNKCLLLDFARIQRKSMILIANDAKSCYDRVILWVLYFTMKKFGMTHQIAKTSVETIKEMVHTVSTVHGQSDATYGGKDTEPNGLLQGNGFAAQIWAAISSILFKIYESEGYGAKITSPISRRDTTVAGFAFVDDTDLVDIERNDETTEQLLQRMQAGIDLWNELIEITGGALEPRKTDWCMITYEKQHGIWIPHNQQKSMTLIDEDSEERIILKQLKTWEARRTLGIYQAVDGNQVTQIQMMTEIIRLYGDQMLKSATSRREKELALNSTISRSLAYGAPATTLSKQQADSINKELRKAVIQGLGVPRSIAKAIIHGPKGKNGLGVLDYYTHQFIEHIKIIMDHLHQDTRTGVLLDSDIAAHMVELGIEESIWEITDPRYLYMMTNTWIKNTLEVMIKEKIRIRAITPKLKKWRRGDKMIMNMILRSPGNKLTLSQWKAVQEVRHHLRVVTLSDILVDGKIDHDTWNGIRAVQSISSTKYEWMKTVPPTELEILQWQQALRMIGIEPPGCITPNTLGSWYDDANIEIAYTDRNKDFIQMNSKTDKKSYRLHQQERNSIQYDIYETDFNFIPDTIHRVRILRKNKNEIWLLEQNPRTIPRTEVIQKRTFHTTEINATDGGEKRLIGKIMNNTAVIVTDASDDKKGNLIAAFCEELNRDEEMTEEGITGYAQIPSKIEDADSFRGELGGVIIAVRYIKGLGERHKLQKGRCMIRLDSDSVIQKVSFLVVNEYPPATEPSFDLLRILRHELKESKITFDFGWIKGHQDDHCPYDELDDAARANCRADKIAEVRIQNVANYENPIEDYAEGPILIMENKKIHSRLSQNGINLINGREIDQYWIKKGRYKEQDKRFIDWISLERATKQFKFADQVILAKLLSNTAPTAKTLHRREKYIDSTCPLCKTTVETTRHLIQCPDKEMDQQFKKQIVAMKHNLSKSRLMDTNMIDACMKYMESLRLGTNGNVWANLCTKQGELGTWALYEGILHGELHKKCGGRRGAQMIIKEMFNSQLRMWKHRCYLVNNKDNNRKRSEKLDREYSETMKSKPRIMNQVDKKRYSMGKETFDRMTLDGKEKWITAMSNLRKKYARLARKGLLRFWAQPRETQQPRQEQNTEHSNLVHRRKQPIRERKQSTLSTWVKRKSTELTVQRDNKRQRLHQTQRERKRQSAATGTQHQNTKRQKTETEKITWWINSQRNPGE